MCKSCVHTHGSDHTHHTPHIYIQAHTHGLHCRHECSQNQIKAMGKKDELEQQVKEMEETMSAHQGMSPPTGDIICVVFMVGVY